MRRKTSVKVAAQLLLVLFLPLIEPSWTVRAQGPSPDRDQLLNGLRVIFLPQPGDGKVSLQLRIHSGAAFDPAGKMGVMTLLADSLFPDAESADFFQEELGGNLRVWTDYDAINVIATGNANEIDRMLVAFRSALTTPQLTDEVVARLKTQRIEAAQAKTRAQLADDAIALRLLGQFPYGRPLAGTPASITPIDRHDLDTARDKFLNPNNATLIVGGTFDKGRVSRLLRQNLGLWRRADRIVPSTFRQPDPPDLRVLLIESTDPQAEIRLAVRGVARADADYPASMVLAWLIQNRIEPLASDAPGKRINFATFEAHVLPGTVVMGGRVEASAAGTAFREVGELALRPLMEGAPSVAELDAAKAKARVQLSERMGSVPGAGGLWLDVDTFKLSDPDKQVAAIAAVTPADIQKLANRLFKETPVARIVMGDLKLVIPALEQAGFKTEAPAALLPTAPPLIPATPVTVPNNSPSTSAPKNP